MKYDLIENPPKTGDYIKSETINGFVCNVRFNNKAVMLRDEWFNYNEKWIFLNTLPDDYEVIKKRS